MIQLFDPSLFFRIYRSPVALFSLIVDLSPLIALVFFDWGIDELVLFYWMENLIIGLGVLIRLLISAVGGRKWSGLFIVPFFTLHYGIFCFIHGLFLIEFFDPHFTGLWIFLALSAALEGVLIVTGFVSNGAYKTEEPQKLMMSPYGRIVIVHLAIFGAAFSASALGSPVGGAIMILILDILWGFALWVFRGRRDNQGAVASGLQS